MSGQAGCYYFDRRPIPRELVASLGRGLARQGPDRERHYVTDGLLITHRASHFDALSQAESQPFVTDENSVVSFDGRLDNRPDLLMWLHRELRGEESDVGLVAAAYSRWGDAGLARLIGDWSLAIWTEQPAAVILASDYTGIIPLYYSLDEDSVRWSSSLQHLVEWINAEEDLDEGWIAAYLHCRPRFDHTVYRRIRAVPPAHRITVGPEGVAISRFWNAPLYDTCRYSEDRLYEEGLLHHFRDAVAVRLRSNRSVACDLSGGLDSSTVTCMAKRLVETGQVEAKHVLAFTEIDHCSEDERHARLVAEQLGIDHVLCDMEPTWKVDVPQPVPMMGAARRLARSRLLKEKGAQINLTGCSGDLIMGNEFDDGAQIADFLTKLRFAGFLVGAYSWSRALRVPIYSMLLRGIVPLLPAEQQLAAWRRKSRREANLYTHSEREAACFTQRIEARRDEDLGVGLGRTSWFRSTPSLRRFHWALDCQSLSRTLETPADLEPIRLSHPYTHRPLVEYIAQIPRFQMCAAGKRRDLMRRTFSGLVPGQILSRNSKSGMGYQHQTEARQLIRNLPSPDGWEVVLRGWVEPSALRDIIGRVSQGTLRDWPRLTMVLTIETWLVSRRATSVHA